jgi:hypothetical protein
VDIASNWLNRQLNAFKPISLTLPESNDHQTECRRERTRDHGTRILHKTPFRIEQVGLRRNIFIPLQVCRAATNAHEVKSTIAMMSAD